MSRPPVLLAVLLLASIASLFGALLVGTFPISAMQVLDSLAFPAPGVGSSVTAIDATMRWLGAGVATGALN